MKDKPLPPQEIREAIEQLEHDELGCGTDKCPHWQVDCFNHDWVVYNGLCPRMIDAIFEVESKHGVVRLAENQEIKFDATYNGRGLSSVELPPDYRKVVSLVDGTEVKEE